MPIPKHKDLSPTELREIRALRESVRRERARESAGESEWEEEFCSDQVLWIYLDVADWSIKDAHKSLCETLDWYQETRPDELLASHVRSELILGKMYVSPGRAREGRPIIVGRRANDSAANTDPDVWLQCALYTMEKAKRQLPEDICDWVWVQDLSAFRYDDSPGVATLASMVRIFNAHYPHRLARLFILNPPSFVSSIWRLMTSFLPDTTAQKFVFVDDVAADISSANSLILEWISLDQLESHFGGLLQHSYDFANEPVSRNERRSSLPTPDRPVVYTSTDKLRPRSLGSVEVAACAIALLAMVSFLWLMAGMFVAFAAGLWIAVVGFVVCWRYNTLPSLPHSPRLPRIMSSPNAASSSPSESVTDDTWRRTGKLNSLQESACDAVLEQVNALLVASDSVEQRLWEKNYLTHKQVALSLAVHKWNMSKATKAVVKTLQWYREEQPHRIDPHTIEKELRQRKLYLSPGVGENGQPIIISNENSDMPVERPELWVTMGLYVMERAIQRMAPTTHEWIWVANMRHFSVSASPGLAIIKKMAGILTAHYPNRLARLFVICAPSFIGSVWSVIKLFLDGSTASKIVFLPDPTSDKAALDALLEVIPRDQLEVAFGGTLDYVYDYDAEQRDRLVHPTAASPQ